MTRQRCVLVLLHWTMAGLIAVLLLSGGLAPAKMHMMGGMIAAVLLALRISVRLNSDHLTPAGLRWQVRTATVMHLGLYGLLIAVVLSGVAVAVEAYLWTAIVKDRPLVDFTQMALYRVHSALTKTLMFAEAGHFMATLWHQLVLRDRILSRMWFGSTAGKQS